MCVVVAGKTPTVAARLDPAVTISGRFAGESRISRTHRVQAIPVGGPVLKRLQREGVPRLNSASFVHASVHGDRSFVFDGLSRGEYVLMDGDAVVDLDEIGKCTKDSVPAGFAFVDARTGSVSGVVIQAFSAPWSTEEVSGDSILARKKITTDSRH
jgi:hypothetical protein